MQTKRCSRCKEVKPVSEFHRRGDRWQSECKPCRKISNAAFYQRTKHRHNPARNATRRALRQWYIDLKRGPCVDCKRTYHPAAMQWDHRPGTVKRFALGVLVKHHSKASILGEIAKCDLVCANCHAVRSWNRLMARLEAQNDKRP